ncbi:MAG TPA: immune inhibitor A, partial [Bacteroidia bacterium]|nr:immune inhibitor A [Bacteroidia bacterium]
MKTINILFSAIIFFTIHHVHAQINIPHCSNFNGANLWNVTTVSGSAWQLGLPQYGATNSTHSPPSCFDIELNAAYLPNTVAYLQSPAFNLLSTPNSRMSFWLNYNSELNWDGARLEYTIDNGVTWLVLGSMNDVLASNWYNSNAILSSNLPAWHGGSGGWKKSTYNLNSFNNQPNISFRFVFTSDGAICTDGFSVDDFCITQAPDVDLRMDSVYIPAIVSANAVVPVNAKVINMGLLPISNFNVYYNQNGTVQGPFVYNGTLQPGGSAIVNCGNLTTIAGANNIKIYTAATNDADLSNDTLIRQMFVVGSSSLGCDDFENQSSWVAMPATGANSWMLGMPNYSLTTGTHSGNNAWDVNLTTGIGAGTATLQSPTYTLSGNQAHQISFWINHALSTGYNGTTLLYSLNGSPYQPLGIVNDPNATNWF